MLIHARKTKQEVNTALGMKEALGMLVRRINASMSSDACTFYLKDTATGEYLLVAADGLNPDAVGKVRIANEEGLVGWIAEHAEAINLANAADHPSFHPNPRTEEASFHGFIGAPVIHYRRVLGILVARKIDRRRFDNEEAAFFITLAAQIGDAVNHLLMKWDASRQLNGPTPGRMVFKGISCAPGIAMGVIALAQPVELQSTPDHMVVDIDAEEKLFLAAVSAAKQELQSSRERMRTHLPGEVLSLFDAYLMLLDSDRLKAGTISRIRSGQWVRGALRDAISELAGLFDQIDNPYLAARAEDIRNIGRHILIHLQGGSSASGAYPKHCILAGTELSLAEISNVPRDRLAGIICIKGSALSHIAIISRAFGIPAVMGLTDLPVGLLEGCETAVDGNRGTVCINPSPVDIHEFHQGLQDENTIAARLETLRDLPSETLDGESFPLYVNLGISDDEDSKADQTYEGVGLYRTEFFFIARDTLPTEDEQYQLYRKVLESFAPKPVTIRTLDAGGDKELPFFSFAETNPFLGRRGIRFTLDHPEIFLTQLRALLRANSGLNNLQLLFPMISRASEIDDTLALLERAYLDLEAEGRAASKPQIGAMIEVPSAVYLISALSRRVDFFSIGTNDLTQYLLAVDRNNPMVQGSYDNLHPSVIHVVHDIVQRAHLQNRPVSVCGEMAGNPASALLLLGLGVDALSMNPSSLPRIKWTIRSFTRRQAGELSEKALQIENEAETNQLLNNALTAVGLSALVSAN